MAHDAMSLDDRARRFLFRRRIGEGAFGVVWEAYDTERGARVALKALTRTEPASLYLFKREFRALADIVHPNLVTLYELLSFGDRWFFTMELVEGADFIEHVRGMAIGPERSAGTDTVTILRSGPVGAVEIPSELTPEGLASGVSVQVLAHDWFDQPTMELSTLRGSDRPSTPIRISVAEQPLVWGGSWDGARGRAALLQLAEGLSALHDEGKLHRDIKPSNVLVTADGRVVILDFGLITELWPTGLTRDSQAVVGTPAFMSPEQSLGRPLTPATDWYSVGVMLYLGLTGRLPFDGAPLQVLIAKQRLDPPPPSTFAKDVPPDLEELCMALLARKPEERLGGEEVLRRLGTSGDAPGRARTSQPHSTFVGRGEELARLREGFSVAASGRTAAAVLHGASGMGKSALAHAFVRDLRRQDPDALVLAGRCFARESVPYKAIDSIIDELSLYLQQLSTTRSAVLMPRGTDALLRMFPVLRQLEQSAPPSLRGGAITADTELRRRAFAALRELLGRLAERKPLVLLFDDLQWSDSDSDALLAELIRPPDAPPMFILATYRLDDVEGAPLVRALRSGGVDTRVLKVGALPFEDARELSLRSLGADEARATAIARESGGNPFLVEALTDHVAHAVALSERSPDSVARVDLREVFRVKIGQLPRIARALLETVAVAGHPIPVIPAWHASGIALPDQSMLSLLLVRHLLRSRTDVGNANEELEPYHERISDAALAGMTPEAIRARHEQLALALEETGDVDPEVLATHFEAAGRFLDAGRHALEAARQAAEALAFDRAARLYRWALTLAPSSDDLDTRERLGDALSNAGRGAEAAEAYLAAARGAPSSVALELRRKAAEQYLISGHIESGLHTVRLVLESVGMKLPQSRQAILLSFLASRARLKLRGLDFRERPASAIAPEQLLRIDACWAVAVGLSLVDAVRGPDFQARHLLLALDAGDPYRVARALALEAVYSAAGGPKGAARTAEIVERSLELAERIRHPHALGLATTMAGAAHYMSGRWRDGLEQLERGARILREQCTGVTWERDTADIFYCTALMQLGRWKELARRHEEFVRDANARGDLYAENHARIELSWYMEIGRDAPDKAREVLARGYSQKVGDSFDMYDMLRVSGTTAIELYAGNPEVARSTIEGAWLRLHTAFFFEIYVLRVELPTLRARARIACASLPDTPPRQRHKLLRAAEKDIASIEEEGGHLYPRAAAAMLRACVATVEGKMDLAREMAERAEHTYSAADMEIHAAAAIYRIGQLTPGERGEAMMASATARLNAQDVRSPERIARMLAPGRWSR